MKKSVAIIIPVAALSFGVMSCSPSVASGGFYKSSLNFFAKDIDSNYAASLGDQKILVVPIALKGVNEFSWSESVLSNINTYYFGEREDTPDQWNSLKSYYETASFGKLRIAGEVTPVYNADFTRNDFYSNNEYSNWGNLMDMISNAAAWVGSSTDINLDEYDNDNNGYIDSIHLIVNGSDGGIWSSALWPHMSQTGFWDGTKSSPVPYTYSLTNLGHVSEADGARTSIHEQGHIFGLPDYYNYTQGVDLDYIGLADMQSYNRFDWNGFSKMQMGWVEPYVFDGSTNGARITIKPAATSGDYIVIPAGEWNGTGYGEYIMIELFSPVGNNEKDWSYWSSRSNLGEGGIRMHHVDSRLVGWGYTGQMSQEIIEGNPKDTDFTSFALLNDNSYNGGGEDDKPLIQVIQKGGTPTFASASIMLSENDLFKTGDVFSMVKYRKTFSNTGVFNNGNKFDFKIHFESVTPESATIVISK